MIPLDRVLIAREHIERSIGRLPRRVAYPLIFFGSVLLWSSIGIAIGKCAS